MDNRYWDLTDIIGSFGSDAFCDWETAPSVSWEYWPLFETIIDTAQMLAMDEYMLHKHGPENCRILMNCLVDVTLMSISEKESPDVYKIMERTCMLYGLLTCRRYQKSNKNWADPVHKTEFLKRIFMEVTT